MPLILVRIREECAVMREICDVEYVKLCLQEHQVMRRVNAVARRYIIDEMDCLAELEMSIYLPSVSHSDLIPAGGSTTDNTYRAYQKLENSKIESERKSLYEQLQGIDESEHRLKRVIMAYHKMVSIMPIHYTLVDNLWFSNRKRTSIHTIKSEMNRGATTLYKMLEDISEAICCIVNSGIPTQSIGKAKQADLLSLMPAELVVRMRKHERIN